MFLLLLACTGDTATDDSGATLDSGDTGTVDVTDPPDWCVEAVEGELQVVVDHAASPYFISHPRESGPGTPTVVFLGGGQGDEGSARFGFEAFFMQGSGIGEVRAVLPYSESGFLPDEKDRILEAIDEVHDCYGGARGPVHIAGTSNGGVAAFDLAYDRPEVFTTLMGVPGVFSSSGATSDLDPLADLRVYNGVGALDTGWKGEVKRIHEAMVAAGMDSTYAEFADQGHSPSLDWDESVLYDFWLAD